MDALIPVREALERLLGTVSPLPDEEVLAARGLGRVLAEEVYADRDFPPTDRSAMDGYALRAADVGEAGGTLLLSGEIRAGSSAEGTEMPRGSAIRVFTGAVVPREADAVVRVERTEIVDAGRAVRILERPRAGDHLRRAGEEAREGTRLLARGVVLHAAELGVLAAVGRTRVRVVRAPLVRILSTGDEIVEPGRRPLPHQIRNSNAATLAALLETMGVSAEYLGIARDERDALDREVGEALQAEVAILTGGVSVGAHDLVAEALWRRGVEPIFHGVAMRPGKPIFAGRTGKTVVLGLPGNPQSAFTGFLVFAAPLILKLMGSARTQPPLLRARLEEGLAVPRGLTAYFPARLVVEVGRLAARPIRSAGSGDLIALHRANAFVIGEGDRERLESGEDVPVLPWGDFHLR